jgi:hypothetical protein
MQNWRKIGLLHNSNCSLEWQHTHAMMPCLLIKDDYLEVYFSPRDSKNQSRPAKLELHLIDDNFHIENLSQTPLLELGELGMYDDSGVMPTCIVKDGEILRMFYNGWTLGKKIPFTSFNGIAESDDQGKSFKKISLAPKALYRNDIDPYSTFAPFVLKLKNEWHMWYVSLIKWENEENQSKHYYHIKYAKSKDGIKWSRSGKVCIDFLNKYEYAIARPCVLFEDDIFKMWYSYRASKKNLTYRIGYAESKNGIEWVRKDNEVNLTTSIDGWDSQMICYSYIFNFKNKKYMLYNGNNYGKTGFGLAILEK